MQHTYIYPGCNLSRIIRRLKHKLPSTKNKKQKKKSDTLTHIQINKQILQKFLTTFAIYFFVLHLLQIPNITN